MFCESTHQAKSAIGEWTSLSHSKFRVHASWVGGSQPKIGFEFSFKPGWYGYFDNPGDSGSNLKLALSSKPTGARILDFNYPIPQSYALGPITNYIYREELFLPVSLELKNKSIIELNLDPERYWSSLVSESILCPQCTVGIIGSRPLSHIGQIDHDKWQDLGSWESYNNNIKNY